MEKRLSRSTTIDKKRPPAPKKVTKVTIPMLNQMLNYCEWAKSEGSYYGNESHFRRRHAKIVAWLEAILFNRQRGPGEPRK